MYTAEEEPEEEPNRAGLNPTAPMAVVIYGGLGGLALLVAPIRPVLYAWATAFLIAIFAVVTPRRIRRIGGSIIGVILFFLSGWYLATQLAGSQILSTRPNGIGISGAAFYFVWLGIPGAAYSLKVLFGRRQNEQKTKLTR